MHLEKIEALITLLHASSMGELVLREGDSTIRLTRFIHTPGNTQPSFIPVSAGLHRDTDARVETGHAHTGAPAAAFRGQSATESPLRASEPRPMHSAAPSTKHGNPTPDIPVLSPMFGVVHLTPSPSDPAFVAVGDTVGVGATLCTVEAMKTFNAVEAETAGVVTAILVKAGDEVKPGQILFRIAS